MKKVFIQYHKVELDVEVYYVEVDDGIGHYEFCGVPGNDKKTKYEILDFIPVYNSDYTERLNNLIQYMVEEHWLDNLIEEEFNNVLKT